MWTLEARCESFCHRVGNRNQAARSDGPTASPQGGPKIAQRFSAGSTRVAAKSPGRDDRGTGRTTILSSLAGLGIFRERTQH